MSKAVYTGPANLYAFILPDVREAAHGCGYAIALHGTMTNDLDLVAIPWIEEVASPEELAETICTKVRGVFSPEMPEAFPPRWEAKPHGRIAVSIYLTHHNGFPFGADRIDLSIMPRRA